MAQASFIASMSDDSDDEDLRFWSAPPDRIRFDRFEVIPSSRTVLHNGRPFELGGRAFDLLLALLRARGTVISKTVIVEQVWPRAIVEDNNIRVQIALLRKSLGRAGHLIKTVSGKGYVFVAELDS